MACRYIFSFFFFFFDILTSGRESITRSSARTKFANSWSEINISSHVIAITPWNFMGTSISADCYRQSHDAHLIFNAIGNVESNNSHLRPSPFVSPFCLSFCVSLFSLICLSRTLSRTITFFFFIDPATKMRRRYVKGTL